MIDLYKYAFATNEKLLRAKSFTVYRTFCAELERRF